MKTLQTKFKYQSRTLRQLKREGRVAIYELLGRGEVLYGYEVVIIKIRPAEIVFEREYPEREVYPSSSKESSDWGSIAWSYGRNYLSDALKRFDGLVAEEQEHGFQLEDSPEVNHLEPSEGHDS